MNVRKLIVFLVLVAVATGLAAGPAQAVQSRNIAVSRVTSSSAVLVVKADVTADVRVDYGASPGTYTATRTGTANTRHEILLDGLNPSSTVYYRVIITDSANPASSVTLPEKSFHTARSQGQPFSFAVAGDNRPAANHGDAAGGLEHHSCSDVRGEPRSGA